MVSVGRLWDGGKRMQFLLGHDHRVPVVIIGPETHPDEALRGGTSSCATRSNVSFYGSQPHPRMAYILSRSSIYGATSHYEPFGLAPLEAAFSRCALVVNDTPSFREIWGDAACYFETNDARSLAQSIETLASSPRLRHKYANRAFERARQCYTAERMVEGYLDLYSRLLARVPGSGLPASAGVPQQ